ncbi:predicted protein [Histoplasma capsulatum H143]|uniref:Uncharacterized protein n=1 Tax=Ajellomyces capsulatus (strain H143) TaxID=544712 RepID=C6HTD7_AJECH|nr:predicted protein [Histoplasma capsulatum H143]
MLRDVGILSQAMDGASKILRRGLGFLDPTEIRSPRPRPDFQMSWRCDVSSLTGRHTKGLKNQDLGHNVVVIWPWAKSSNSSSCEAHRPTTIIRSPLHTSLGVAAVCFAYPHQDADISSQVTISEAELHVGLASSQYFMFECVARPGARAVAQEL